MHFIREIPSTQVQSDGHPAEATHLARRINRFARRVRDEWSGTHMFRNRRAPAESDVVMMSNDYLSLSTHPQIVEAQIETLRRAGNGMLMSAVFLHERSTQHAFESRMARFLGADAAVLCQSGWAANVGLLQCIAEPGVPVYIDMRAHMSLWEGVSSARATPRPFRHNDAEHLGHLMRRHGPGIVVVDAVYSTEGDLCPLDEVVREAEASGSMVVVDESHSLGTHGQQGAGLVPALGLGDRVHFRTASLAKAFAGRAGLITCSRRFADYFPFESRPAIFSSALLPHEIAGLEATIGVVRRERWRRTRLHRNAEYLRAGLAALGYNVAASRSQIIALEAGSEAAVGTLQDELEAQGIYGAVFVSPATPKNRGVVRLSVSCAHSPGELDRVLDACAEIRDRVRLEDWPSTRRANRTPARARRIPPPPQAVACIAY